jgi:hypothetical protein
MKKTTLNDAAFALAVFLCCDRASLAADPTTQPIDKSQYTLFNPVPVDLLRDMDTDRPDKTNTPHTIDAGWVQLETGFFDYVYYRNRYQGANARTDSLDLAQLNFRLGVLENLELNVVIDPYDFQRNIDYQTNQSSHQNGIGDTVVGGKFNFWGNDMDDKVWATALGIQPQFKIPSARENLGNGHPELFVGLPFLVNLPGGFHLGLQPTISWERNSTNTGQTTGFQNSASLDRVLIGKFDVYLEYWSHVSTQRHQESQQTLDVGFTYPWNDNVTFDSGVNFGLNKASDTIEVVSGVSIRF